MPTTSSFPFRRLSVDHLIEGGSRIWWELDPAFRVAQPWYYQLQAGKTGLTTATDWVDVGSAVLNGYYAVDDQKRLYGKRLETHYRVVLTTGSRKYVSLPVHVEGQLDEASWLKARELLRKDTILDPLVSVEGYLIKRLRYGARCTRCLNTLTNEIEDSRCPQCRGTGYKVGYHPPVPLCIRMDPMTISELRNGTAAPGQTQYNTVTAHTNAFPQLALEDIWVDANSDLRFALDTIKHTAAIRGVPLFSQVTMHQLPFTDLVYTIPVGGEANDHPLSELPDSGTGSARIDHDTGGEDELAYTIDDGCGIAGATILAIPAADYANGLRTAANAVAASTTLANGRWAYAMNLDPGDYVLIFEKVGYFGPDTVEITVTVGDSSVSSTSSISSEFGPV